VQAVCGGSRLGRRFFRSFLQFGVSGPDATVDLLWTGNGAVAASAPVPGFDRALLALPFVDRARPSLTDRSLSCRGPSQRIRARLANRLAERVRPSSQGRAAEFFGAPGPHSGTTRGSEQPCRRCAADLQRVLRDRTSSAGGRAPVRRGCIAAAILVERSRTALVER